MQLGIRHRSALGTVAAFFILLSLEGACQDSATSEREEAPTGRWAKAAKIELQVLQKSVLPGQPIPFELRITNDTQATIERVPLLIRYASLRIRHGDRVELKGVGHFFRLIGKTDGQPLRGKLVADLKPGEKILLRFFIWGSLMPDRPFWQTPPGTAKIVLEILDDEPTIERIIVRTSNEIEVEVRKPTGDDARALELLSTLDSPSLLWTTPGSPRHHLGFSKKVRDEDLSKNKDLKIVREIVEKFPKSQYSRLAKFYVAATHFFSAIGYNDDENNPHLEVASVERVGIVRQIISEMSAEQDDVYSPQLSGFEILIREAEGAQKAELEVLIQQLEKKYGNSEYFRSVWLGRVE